MKLSRAAMTKSCKVINGSEAWRNSSDVIDSNTCVLHGIGDVHPFDTNLEIRSQTVIFDRCDKNFIYYWLNDVKTFTNMKTVILGSHPCEPSIINWLERRCENNRKERTKLIESYIKYNCSNDAQKSKIYNYIDNPLDVYLHEYYFSYVDRWSLHNVTNTGKPGIDSSIKVLSGKEYNSIVSPLLKNIND